MVLLGHAVIARSVALLKRPFLLAVVVGLLLLTSSDVIRRFSGTDTVQLVIQNHSDALLEWVDIHGRGEEVRVDSLPAGSRTVVPFRGRRSNVRLRDSYADRILVTWFAQGQVQERVLVGQWLGVGDSLAVVFRGGESVGCCR